MPAEHVCRVSLAGLVPVAAIYLPCSRLLVPAPQQALRTAASHAEVVSALLRQHGHGQTQVFQSAMVGAGLPAGMATHRAGGLSLLT